MASLRDYQEEVVAMARQENVVMVGSTGIGKTFVSIMLLREQDYSVKRAFVMAPTRQLVCQIYSKILKLTTLKVAVYCGRELDVWDQFKWEREIMLNRVFVCTPEILRNIIAKGYITMDRINLLVFDECHHVTKRHPYNQIMKLYNPNEVMPRIFGTTACPTRDCGKNMHARIKKISMEAKEMSLYAACAPVIHETYPPNSDYAVDQLTTRVTELLNELDALQVFEYLLKKGYFGSKKQEDKLAARVSKFLSDCVGVYQNLGTWCLYRFVYLELEKQARRASLKWTTAGNMTGLDPKAIYAMLLCVSKRNETQFGCTPKVQKIAEIIHQRLFSGSVPFEDSMQDDDDGEIIPCDNDDEDGTTDKDAMEEEESDDPVENDCFSDVSSVCDDEVLDVIDEDKEKTKAEEQLKCVIFVNRRAECRVLADFLNERFPTRIDDDGNEVKLFGCMLGQASASDAASYDLPDMQKTLESFESGQARVMVSTSVSCEGVDFPLCSMVICADTIQCPRKFIQVRGRARHTDGVCFYLTDASAVEEGKQFHVLSRQAEEIGRLEFKCDKAMTTKHQPLSVIALKNQFHYTITHLENNPTIPSMLKVNSTGAILDLDSSISCLNMFCQSLPFFQKYNLNPVFDYEHKIEDKKNYYKVKLTLPSDLEIEPIITPFMSSKMNSKAVAAFWACEKLYQLGKLDENLNSIYRQKKHRSLVQLQERAGDYQTSKRFKSTR